MKKFFLFLGKHILIIVFIGLVVGRLFFPTSLEETVISPVRKMPVFGQVLGLTWDKMGKVGPALSQKSVELADSIESAQLPIDEAVMQVVESDNPGSEASKLLELQVDKTVDKIDNLPAEILNQVRQQVRQEMYKQICSDWVVEQNKTGQTQTNNN